MSETLTNSENANSAADNPWQKMADEVLAEAAEKADEKEFYESKIELSNDQKREFREMLLGADVEKTKELLDARISFLEEMCEKPETIGHIHRGYIGSNTDIQFQSGAGVAMANKYRIKDSSYMYEMVAMLQSHKESIRGAKDLFKATEIFLNSYFGIPRGSEDMRPDVIEEKTDIWNPNLSDDEMWETLDNVDISIFKGEHVAQCTERAAMAQNILSLFGYETYYTQVGAKIDGVPEQHALNIVSNNRGDKNFMDFSITSTMEYNGTTWIIPNLSKIADFDGFLQGKNIETSTWEYHLGEDGKWNPEKGHAVEYSFGGR